MYLCVVTCTCCMYLYVGPIRKGLQMRIYKTILLLACPSPSLQELLCLVRVWETTDQVCSCLWTISPEEQDPQENID